MRYLSVCSGIEAATVAWRPLGWTAVGVSEIDPFCRAVLAQRLSSVRQLGDLTYHESWDLQPSDLDLLVGGTPCQSFSVAGLRAGLEDPRGLLALVYLELARQLRPRWVVWENVPGVLSADRGRAFGSLLGGLAELGYGFAWRVLDARYFGLAQQRKRVFLVGRLGDWRGPAAVLLERSSLSGDPRPSRSARPSVADGTLSRALARVGGGDDPGAQKGAPLVIAPEVAAPLTSGGCPNSRPPGRRGEDDHNLVGEVALCLSGRGSKHKREPGDARLDDDPGRYRTLPLGRYLRRRSPARRRSVEHNAPRRSDGDDPGRPGARERSGASGRSRAVAPRFQRLPGWRSGRGSGGVADRGRVVARSGRARSLDRPRDADRPGSWRRASPSASAHPLVLRPVDPLLRRRGRGDGDAPSLDRRARTAPDALGVRAPPGLPRRLDGYRLRVRRGARRSPVSRARELDRRPRPPLDRRADRRGRRAPLSASTPGVLTMPTQLPGSFESTWHHATLGVVSDVLVARSDMLSSWGDPSYPSVVRISEPPPYVLDLGERQTGVYGLPTARQARDLTEASRGVGSLTWGRIAVQALSDAIAAPDDAARRREVVQLAAVALAWIEDIDRRRRARPAGLEARSAQEIVP